VSATESATRVSAATAMLRKRRGAAQAQESHAGDRRHGDQFTAIFHNITKLE
jgi:hypothetical protein